MSDSATLDWKKVHEDVRAEVGLGQVAAVDVHVGGLRVRPGAIDVYADKDNLIVWFNEESVPMAIEMPPEVGEVHTLGRHAYLVRRRGAPLPQTAYKVSSGGKPCEGNSAPNIIIR